MTNIFKFIAIVKFIDRIKFNEISYKLEVYPCFLKFWFKDLSTKQNFIIIYVLNEFCFNNVLTNLHSNLELSNWNLYFLKQLHKFSIETWYLLKMLAQNYLTFFY